MKKNESRNSEAESVKKMLAQPNAIAKLVSQLITNQNRTLYKNQTKTKALGLKSSQFSYAELEKLLEK